MFPAGPCRLNPSTPAGYAELLVRGRIDAARSRVISTPRDRGASVVEWVLISAILVAAAIAVGTLLLNKMRDKANSINLDTPAGTP